MAKKIKLEATEAQVNALVEIMQEWDAGLGTAEDDTQRVKWMKLVDRMLLNNGFDRNTYYYRP